MDGAGLRAATRRRGTRGRRGPVEVMSAATPAAGAVETRGRGSAGARAPSWEAGVTRTNGSGASGCRRVVEECLSKGGGAQSKTENGVCGVTIRGEGGRTTNDARLRLRRIRLEDTCYLLHTDTKTKFFFLGRLQSSYHGGMPAAKGRRVFTRIFRRARGSPFDKRDISTLHYNLLGHHHCERAKTTKGWA